MTVEITAPVDISALPDEVKNRIIMAAIPVAFAAGDGFVVSLRRFLMEIRAL